ncbi:MAG: alpha/beta hydrolase [Ginsengibacter sp.]
MDTQYVHVDDLKIAYIEKNKDAPSTFFFIPGNSVSKRIWRKQFESISLSAYRMIAIDLPAHADSDAAPETAYTLPDLAELLYKVINKLTNNTPYILAGVSLGTNIIAEMLAFKIHPIGLVLAGPCVFGKNYTVEQIAKPGTHVGVVFADDPHDNDVVSYAHEIFLSPEDEDLKIFLEDFKRVQDPFRSSLAKSIFDGNYNDEVELLQQKNIPSLIIFGRNELVINCNYLDNAELPLWNKMICKIEGASHFVNSDQPVEFNKLLGEFAEDIFK